MPITTPPIEKGRTRCGAAAYLRTKHNQDICGATLANMASEGTGPVYRKIAGKSYYLDNDLDAWAQSRVSRPIRKASDVRQLIEGEAVPPYRTGHK